MLIHLNVSKFLNALTANTSILVVIEKIYRYQFKSNYLKNHKFFAAFFCIFGIYIKFPMFWKKNEPHSSSISEVIDSERCACLNA